MEDPPLLAGLLGALALVSFFLWAWIAARVFYRLEIIPYEPRAPVPWQGWDLGIVIALFLVILSAAVAALQLFGQHAEIADAVSMLLADNIAKLAACGAAVAYLRNQCKATWFDLGIDLGKLQSDALLGFLAFLAACPPVYGLMYALTRLLNYDHPMVKLLEKQPDTATLLLAACSAIIVAPIAEELFFRVLLQGWLEAVERRVRDLRAPSLTRPPSALPILGSSLLFALSHVGNGPDQLPLFVFAVFLGYLYRQTHRLAPSVVTHLCLNAASIAQLWYAAGNSAG